MKNKKGMALWFTISLVIAFFVISIISSILGIKFITSIMDSIKWEYLLIAIITILAIIFQDIVRMIFLTIWSWIVGIVNVAVSLFR